MQNRMPILVALLVGVVAVVLTNMYVTQVREESLPPSSLVVVAASDLAAGAILEAKDVAEGVRFTQSLPKLHIPWGERNLYLGQELRTPVSAGDYVLISYFGAQAGAARLSEKVDGRLKQRAFTISVSPENTLEGSIRAGDRLDLLLTYAIPKAATTGAPGGTGGPGTGTLLPQFATVPLLENVYVISAGRFDGGDTGRYKSLTLMVEPDEAKLLAWAMRLGELSILLRNPQDVATTDRAFLSGDSRALAGLGRIPMTVEDVISKGED
jgi:pilus assembly protein CpaB